MPETCILGIDEVGRGPWAGPLVVGAVVLGEKFFAQNLLQQPTEIQDFWHSLTDSKKLTDKKRTALSKIILSEAAATGLGLVSAPELDQRGLSASLKLATRRAVKQVLATKTPFTEIIIDGTINFLDDTPLSDRVTLLKKADFLIKEVSAASIIAKVARDEYMKNLANQYPDYSFERHVGYGTAAHRAALEKYGTCPEHRQSFKPIQKIAQNKQPGISILARSGPRTAITASPTARGQYAENLVADYLKSQGHNIIAHNFKTKAYEIDLISTLENQIFFTEVKYRKNTNHGTSLEQITAAKQCQMQFAAQAFLSQHPEIKHQPVLAAAAASGVPPQIEAWFALA